MKESCQEPSGKQAVQGQESLPSVAVSQQSFIAAKCVWDVLFGWIENSLRTARLRDLRDASTSPHTCHWMCFTNQSQAGREERQPEDSTADIPKAKQRQRSVPLLPRPCRSRRTHWLMIQARKHTERPAGSLEDQFITLYFVWPPPALVARELYNTLSAQMVWM